VRQRFGGSQHTSASMSSVVRMASLVLMASWYQGIKSLKKSWVPAPRGLNRLLAEVDPGQP
jgi:hypothetical protein